MPDLHTWTSDADGPLYYEPRDGHGGPLCARCGYTYCQHCHPDGPPESECDPEDMAEWSPVHL